MPLWENKFAHRPPAPPEATYLWSWEKIRPLIDGAITVASPQAIERRVLQLVPPQRIEEDAQQTSKTISANIQILLPGEKARPHRHTMNALRFVLEGSGAITVVDGKPCPMEEGDLVLTPAWTWHEHVHQGTAPIVWLDALDAVAPLHGHGRVPAGTGGRDARDRARRRFCAASVVPDTNYTTRVFPGLPLSLCQRGRGGRGRAARARRLAARALHQSAHRRHQHGADGCFLVQLDAGATTIPFRTSAGLGVLRG
jgi:gentisate 1,2-dioxygenase